MDDTNCVSRNTLSTGLCVPKPGTMVLATGKYRMHLYLRAWRKHRGLSLEQVANSLGKRPSTVGRWEKGEMKLATADLERLASLYNAKPVELLAPPDMSELVARLDEVQTILSALSTEDRDHWLSIGRSLARNATLE